MNKIQKLLSYMQQHRDNLRIKKNALHKDISFTQSRVNKFSNPYQPHEFKQHTEDKEFLSKANREYVATEIKIDLLQDLLRFYDTIEE
jgi:DNA-nicking Smr family endonuclease